MYNIRNQNSGEFEFVARIPSERDIAGRLEWTHIGPHRRDIKLLVKVFLHDERLDSTNVKANGEWEVAQTANTEIGISRLIMNDINISGLSQQTILEISIDRIIWDNDRLRELYPRDTEFLSRLEIVRQKDNEDISLLTKLDRTIRNLISGKFPFDINATRQAEGIGPNPIIKKYSINKFRWITSLSGIFTVVMCIIIIGKSDIATIIVAGAAAFTAWAARETALIDSMSKDYDYSFSTHWRNSLWKLIGYTSTAMVSVLLISKFQ